MSRSIARSTLTLATALVLAAPPAFAADGVLAIPDIAGPKGAGARFFEDALGAEFANAGFEVVGPKELKKAAARIRGKRRRPANVAREAGAHFLIEARVRRKGAGRYQLSVELFDLQSGKVAESAKWNYRKSRDDPAKGYRENAGNAAIAIAKKFAPVIAEAMSKREPESVAEIPDDPLAPGGTASPASPATATTPASTSTPPSPSTPATASTPPTSEPTEVMAFEDEAPTDQTTPVIIIGLTGGTQAATSYTVAVGGTSTGLAYGLGPGLLVGAGFRVNIPSTDIGVEADFSLATAKYDLDTQPATTPADPSGLYVNFGATGLYSLMLAELGEGSAIKLEPMVGLGINLLSVSAQAPTTIVVGSTAIVPHLGARTRLLLGSFEADLDVRFRIVVAYSESPVRTGDGGFGIGLDASLGGTYWVTPMLGIGGRAGYDFTRVGFSGSATRANFVSDPALVDASASASALKVGLAVKLAF